MTSLSDNLNKVHETLPEDVTLVAVSKTKPHEMVQEAYDAGQRVFGENKVQELVGKYEALPKDIEWHLIGHLQTNKVKYIVPFVSLIHAVDSEKLLVEIQKRAQKIDRVQPVLIQLYIAQEESKFGLSQEEALALLDRYDQEDFSHVSIEGMMGMASNSSNQQLVASEFGQLNQFFKEQQALRPYLKTLSMGMSGDYTLAVEQGSNMVRIGSTIFGARNYTK
ncbi:YggS family pyridoxal phosphate-dependent enzyme [bacterium SCSIO 12741]|nr:YggS family pyridoxal phosphate-dependent enzyme [bacterium SCSIO 12741]